MLLDRVVNDSEVKETIKYLRDKGVEINVKINYTPSPDLGELDFTKTII